MYVSEFICGIIATLGVELTALIIYTFRAQKDGKDEKDEKKEEQDNGQDRK